MQVKGLQKIILLSIYLKSLRTVLVTKINDNNKYLLNIFFFFTSINVTSQLDSVPNGDFWYLNIVGALQSVYQQRVKKNLQEFEKGRLVQPTKYAQFENLLKFYLQYLSQWHLCLFIQEEVCGIFLRVLLIFP